MQAFKCSMKLVDDEKRPAMQVSKCSMKLMIDEKRYDSADPMQHENDLGSNIAVQI